MKIDRSKLKKSTSDVPLDCKALIDKLKSSNDEELLCELKKIETWTFGKCELYHWIDVLDICDTVLENAVEKESEKSWGLACDLPRNKQLKDLLLWTLHFTTLLIEHSFSRHLYNSMEHLTTLLSSSDMSVVLGVLSLLYMFSKRSNFISRMANEKRQALIARLTHLAESWGGRENGFGLAECCKELSLSSFPSSSTTLHFEYYPELPTNSNSKTKGSTNVLTSIHVESVDKLSKSPAQIMEELIQIYDNISQEKQIQLFTHLRLACSFPEYRRRLQCVQARLQSLSVLVYSNALVENAHTLLYMGLLEELVDVLELEGMDKPHLMDIKAAALRTLTSVIHLERSPNFPKSTSLCFRLNTIIDVTGASSYHGFLPVMVRMCISSFTSPTSSNVSDGPPPFPLPLATALFSFLYHLASYEAGGEALVSCGMMESLLRIVNWPGKELEHITFVTRAVRVVDLITNLDMQAFQTHGGLISFINRLELEVNACRKEQSFEIKPAISNRDVEPTESSTSNNSGAGDNASTSNETLQNDTTAETNTRGSASPMDVDVVSDSAALNEVPLPSTSASEPVQTVADYSAAKTGLTCLPQRAALLKSMLNFLKKAIQDPSFSDSIRHVMEGSLPSSLKHVISNAEYYGPSLFLLATDVVTVHVFQEPSLLSSLQDNGLTDVVLHALLVKDVPATREVLGSLPNVFSALCLNTRGLNSFVACKPFERLFKVLLSPDYLPAMRRRRSSDPMGDTASNLGNAMDELMRHQPSLKVNATAAIIKLLEELCILGRDPTYVCWRPQTKNDMNLFLSTTAGHQSNPVTEGGTSSDEEEEEEEEASTSSHQPVPQRSNSTQETSVASPNTVASTQEKTPIPLVDYILNVMKFVDAILSNNSTDDHCREFVTQKGLMPLMGILGLPNLPIDFPITPACQAVTSVSKSILNLAHEPTVLKQGLLHLNEVLRAMEPLYRPLEGPGGSVLLHELASAVNVTDATNNPSATPLLHAMSAAHAYITMFVHVCRTGQSDIRTISVSHWGSELGLTVLKGLTQLYTSLVWESTVLLALCTEDSLPAGCQFGKADMDKMLPAESKTETDGNIPKEEGSNGEIASPMETLSVVERPTPPINMEVDSDASNSASSASGEKQSKDKISPALQHQIKQIKPLLSVSSRLGRALAELFGLLVKLCVGSPLRQRRGHQIPVTPVAPTAAARSVASSLTSLLAQGLSWIPPPTSPVPRFRLTFYICSVGFTAPMLFDERKYPYHLMLQNFLKAGGQSAFFEAFNWALSSGGKFSVDEGLEHPDLPDSSGEFLDTWLTLLEKMVNPKLVLESPHSLPAKSNQPGYKPFNAVKYLMLTHKLAFNAIMILWDKKPLKTYGGRMCESILTILCHILRGESIIQERLAKESKETGTPSTSTADATTRRREEPEMEVNNDHLQQLIDMGFTREHALEALLHSTSVEQAAEFLLANPPVNRIAQSMDLDISEEDQMMRAIAMSLGENALVSTDGKEPEKKEESEKEEDVEGLSKEVIDTFTTSALNSCLNILDSLPDSVFRVCELIVAIVNRNGDQYREKTLQDLVNEIHSKVSLLAEVACKKDCTLADLGTCPDSAKAAIRIHLFTLLFEDMRTPCAQIVEQHSLVEPMVNLLCLGEQVLHRNWTSETTNVAVEVQCGTAETNDSSAGKSSSGSTSVDKVTTSETTPPPATPKWMAPLLLLLDLYQRVAIATRRRDALKKVASHNWKWFDMNTGKWCAYSSANNKAIDDAFWKGESTVKVTAGRRRYTIQFNTMAQFNDETGNRRPILLWLQDGKEPKEKTPASTDSKETKGAAANNSTTSKTEVEKTETKESSDNKDEKSEKMEVEELEKCAIALGGLTLEQGHAIVRASMGLIGPQVDPDTLHAVMRICLRLTRDYETAVIFAEMGGVERLLELTQASSFAGFLPLASLLIRHILEETKTLRHTVEKMVRARTMASTAVTSKEFHHIMRVLSAAACRHPEIFGEVARSILRVDITIASKRGEEEETRMLMKALPSKPGVPIPIMEGVSRVVITQLLNALAQKVAIEEIPAEETPAASATKGSKQAGTQTIRLAGVVPSPSLAGLPPDLLRNTSASDLLNSDVEEQSSDSVSKNSKDQGKDLKTEEQERKKRPLLAKSAICRLLAEIVRSYAGSAKLIAEYYYSERISELINDDCSALAFMLDQLLPPSQTVGDKDCPNAVRLLMAALASVNHSPDAQTVVVTEVKAALLRALALTECDDKHERIQVLTTLISTMIENCPSLTQSQPQSGSLKHQQQCSMNNIVKIMVKKGVLTDLARIPHHLDLSGPNMAATVNAALKPLETLSRIVNQPTSLPTAGRNSKQKQPETGTTNSEVTHAQGEEQVEDTDNTEHDISAAGESLDPASEGHVHEGDEATFDEIIDRLLDRDGDHSEDPMLAETLMVENETSRNEMETDDNLHDSQMLTQHSEFGGDDTQDEEDHGESSDSDSEHSEEDADDGDDEDDEVEEEEEDEEEDEEGGSGYDEDREDFLDAEEAIIRLPGISDANRDVADDMMMIQYDTDPVMFGSDSTRPALLPFSIYDDVYNGNESIAGVRTSHPLLMAPVTVDSGTVPATTRAHRTNRQRRYHYIQFNPRHSGHQPNILQRLLGSSTAVDVQHLNASQVLNLNSTSLRDTRVLVMDNTLGIFASSEDDQLDFMDQLQCRFNSGSTSLSLGSIQNALYWWNEEAKVLDGGSMHDCIILLKPEILKEVEKHHEIEVAEKQEKKKKQQEEDEAKKKKEEEEKKNKENTEGEMEVNVVDLASTTQPPTATTSTSAVDTSTSTTPATTTLSSATQQQQVSSSTVHINTSQLADSIMSSVLLPSTTSTAVATSQTTATTGSTLAELTSGLLSTLSDMLPGVASHMASAQENTVSSLDSAQSLRSMLQLVMEHNLPPEGLALTNSSSSSSSSDGGSTYTTPLSSIINSSRGEGSLESSAAHVVENVRALLNEAQRAATNSTTPAVPPRDPWLTPAEVAMEMASNEDTTLASVIIPSVNMDNASQPQTAESTEGGSTAAEPQASNQDATAASTLETSEGTSSQESAPPFLPLVETATSAILAPSFSIPSSSTAVLSRSDLDFSAILGNIEIPEGVDPSFLAALPEEMREEVIAEQLRLQRIRQHAQVAPGDAPGGTPSLVEVNADFLAALPPNIQEEVLAQQRLEQQRRVATTSNPNDPIDAAAFFQNLQPSLRQSILADIEDSQMSALPPDLAAEAQNLRREWEARNRQFVQDRFFGHVHSGNALSSILRNTVGRLGARYAIHTVPQRAQWGSWPPRGGLANSNFNVKFRGRQLLDHEGLSCLLVLLFVDEPKLNITRLQRVLKNLCYHSSTRDWVVRSLLSVMEHTNECQGPDFPSSNTLESSYKGKKSGSRSSANQSQVMELSSPTPALLRPESIRTQTPSWLSVSMDAALGCRANVFSIQRHHTGGKKSIEKQAGSNISIHPQAAPLVCRHSLDVLIALAKNFSSNFLPTRAKESECNKERDSGGGVSKDKLLSSIVPTRSEKKQEYFSTDFWEMLLKLDSLNASRKGKSVARTHSTASTSSSESDLHGSTFDASAFGHLVTMLSCPVVRRSSMLTDKMLRLLSSIASGVNEAAVSAKKQEVLVTAGTSKDETKKEEQVYLTVGQQHLKLAVDVLTSKSCSEEGLEDATSLLLHLSYGPSETRDMILKLLLDGSEQLGAVVCCHIAALMQELREMNAKLRREKSDGEDQDGENSHIDKPHKGHLQDRFTKEAVVVTASTKSKTGCELQLPSMSALTCKTSSQAFFLRVLKVIIQLREATRAAAKKNKKKVAEQTEPLSSIRTQGDILLAAIENTPARTGPSDQPQLPAVATDTDPIDMDITPVNQAVGQASSTGSEATQQSSNVENTEGAMLPVAPLAQFSTDANPIDMDTTTQAVGQTAPEGTLQPSSTANTEAITSPITSNAQSTPNSSAPMEIDTELTPKPSCSTAADVVEELDVADLPRLSEQLILDELWDTLSKCLLELAETPDHHAVLVLQPAVEAFFLVHASSVEKEEKKTPVKETREAQLSHLQEAAPASPLPSVTDKDVSGTQQQTSAELPPDTCKFLQFAETHRTVLNQILRQSTAHLADGPFSVLVDHTRVLDFDVKRRYFRTELERMDEGIRREDLAVHVRRSHVFEDSFRELHRRSAEEWKNRFYIVFEGEEGQDAGGLLREWYVIISREIFNPMYALFCTSPGDRVTYMINSTSHCNPNHLCYFKFVGRVIAKAVYDNKLLECYFTRSFYKHILGKYVKYTDMETEDYSFYQGLVYLMEHDVCELGYDLTFSTEVQEFGVNEVRDLITNGRNIPVTEENKMEYIRLVCQMKMTGAIRKQLNAFLEGFYDIIPKRFISIFNEQELELLISGLPNIDIEDLKANTEYHKYQPTSLQIQWFWRALRSFDQADRAKFLQFVTGTSKVPLQGFSSLEGMNGVQKFQIHRDDRSTDRLPSAHTCFNQLDLPAYETYDKLRTYLLKAIHECSEGFGFA